MKVEFVNDFKLPEFSVPAEVVLPLYHRQWIAKLRRVPVFLGPRQCPYEGFLDLGADLSSLRSDLIPKELPRSTFPIKTYDSQIKEQVMVCYPLKIGQYAAEHFFLVHSHDEVPVIIGADLIYEAARAVGEWEDPSQAFAKIMAVTWAQTKAQSSDQKARKSEETTTLLCSTDMVLANTLQVNKRDFVAELCVDSSRCWQLVDQPGRGRDEYFVKEDLLYWLFHFGRNVYN